RATASRTRIDNVTVRLAGAGAASPPLTVNGLRLSDIGNHIYLTLRLTPSVGLGPPAAAERNPDTGLLTRSSFAEAASKVLHEVRAAGRDCQLTMFDLQEFEDLRLRLDQETQAEIAGSLGTCLRTSSVGGDTAGQLQDGRYGLVHRDDVNPELVGEQIVDIARFSDPSERAIGLDSTTVEVDAVGLTETETAKALLYTINRYCASSGQPFNIRALSDSLGSLVDETAERINRFSSLIEDDGFEMVFQPICDLATGRPHHFEVLVRFDQMEMGSSPYEYITFAEEVGIICDFDLAMVRRVLDWLHTVNRTGHRYMAAVNLSGRSLSTPSFVSGLLDLLAANHEVRDNVLFELTETARIGNLSEANRVIQGLRGTGHIVCLDDFGAGEAAFRYLRALDVDVVKIDGQYLRSAMRTVRGKALLRAMAGMCRDLSITTIAELVETEAEVGLVRECGIRLGQGHYYGAPSKHVAAFPAPKPVAFAVRPTSPKL
ncbi:MAG: EAL domain-containing protein, partial [Alphaproteobacteria bacterium]